MTTAIHDHMCVHNVSRFQPSISSAAISLGATAHVLARAAAGQFGVAEPYIEALQGSRFRGNQQLSRDSSGNVSRSGVARTIPLVFLHPRRSRPSSQASRLLQGKRHPFRGHHAARRFMRLSRTLRACSPPTTPGCFARPTSIISVALPRWSSPSNTMTDAILKTSPRRISCFWACPVRRKPPFPSIWAWRAIRSRTFRWHLAWSLRRRYTNAIPLAFSALYDAGYPRGNSHAQARGSGRGAASVAASYAEPEMVYQDLEQARALMRKLGSSR